MKSVMKKSFLLTRVSMLLVCVLLFCAISPLSVVAEELNSDEIIILYENDVHCNVSGYSKLSAMKQQYETTHEYVGVVSVGDFVQGDTLGTISKGEYIVNIMNMVGYDAITLGNHEFDYKLERLDEICNSLDTKPVCSNFVSLNDNTSVYEPYVMKSYGDIDIAYIGVTTPDTLTSSSPIQFMDENGKYIYGFCSETLYATVQTAIDSAQIAGADYIIGLTHLGTEDVFEQWSAQTLVKETSGFDVVLDAHSHSVLEGMVLQDKFGNDVIVSSTGTKFANIGKLTISDDKITTELLKTEAYTNTDADIDNYISVIKEEYSELGNRVIGKSKYDLLYADENGNRIIRNTQSNLGDFCADAFRVVTNADIGVMNGGGIRTGLNKGEVTFNDILSIFPFNNTVCVARVTGQQILDFLELSVSLYPEENGSFQHVSGLAYTLNSYIPSSVKFDENMTFVSVEGERRVSDVKVLNSTTGEYEAIDPSKYYTLASHNYLLLDHGSGATMFDDAEIVSNNGMLDVELLEIYINDYLGGVIGEEYAVSQNRMTIVTEKAPETQPSEPDTSEPDTNSDNKDNSDTSPNTGDSVVRLVIPMCMAVLLLSAMATVNKYKSKQET